jgi:hypothetical protein
MRARRVRALVASVGAGILALCSVGCPEPADLQNPNQYPLPATGGMVATTGGTGSNGAECESACMAAIIKATCKTCHGTAIKLAGTLDMESAGYTGRLKDKLAEHAAVADATTCPKGDKLIDTATPANSWLLKKIMNQQGTCGTIMPSTGALSAADQTCVQTYVSCVAPGGAMPSGGTGSGGTASGGTASGGTASGGTASGGTASGGTASGGTASGGGGASAGGGGGTGGK